MKILALSDIHGDKSFVRQMAEKGAQEKVDLVILAGDLVNEFDGSSEGLIGPFKEKGLEVAIIPGNHEGLAEINFIKDKYNVTNLHGYSLKFGDVGIFGCGYADIMMHQLTDKEFLETLKKAHESIKDCKKKLMVTHVQPNDSILGLKMPGWGSSGVRKAIEELKPDVHICGHIHETHGIEEVIGQTRVINVGKTGRIIEL
ncbi:MAG TPA: metallophosphoesterase [Candidatus Nanoarchaeia archaeon]|nr:metallophosphoesterase [Candidatus Nanoarchaeia archaeon]